MVFQRILLKDSLPYKHIYVAKTRLLTGHSSFAQWPGLIVVVMLIPPLEDFLATDARVPTFVVYWVTAVVPRHEGSPRNSTPFPHGIFGIFHEPHPYPAMTHYT